MGYWLMKVEDIKYLILEPACGLPKCVELVGG